MDTHHLDESTSFFDEDVEDYLSTMRIHQGKDDGDTLLGCLPFTQVEGSRTTVESTSDPKFRGISSLSNTRSIHLNSYRKQTTHNRLTSKKSPQVLRFALSTVGKIGKYLAARNTDNSAGSSNSAGFKYPIPEEVRDLAFRTRTGVDCYSAQHLKRGAPVEFSTVDDGIEPKKMKATDQFGLTSGYLADLIPLPGPRMFEQITMIRPKTDHAAHPPSQFFHNKSDSDNDFVFQPGVGHEPAAQKKVSSGCVGPSYRLPINVAIQFLAIDGPTLQHMIRAAPSALLTERDGTSGYTSLHVVLKWRPEDTATLDSMLLKCPSASWICDHKHNTPLHTACTFGASLKSIRHLVIMYPEALFMRNFNLLIPSQIVQRCNARKLDDVAAFLRRAEIKYCRLTHQGRRGMAAKVHLPV